MSHSSASTPALLVSSEEEVALNNPQEHTRYFNQRLRQAHDEARDPATKAALDQFSDRELMMYYLMHHHPDTKDRLVKRPIGEFYDSAGTLEFHLLPASPEQLAANRETFLNTLAEEMEKFQLRPGYGLEHEALSVTHVNVSAWDAQGNLFDSDHPRYSEFVPAFTRAWARDLIGPNGKAITCNNVASNARDYHNTRISAGIGRGDDLRFSCYGNAAHVEARFNAQVKDSTAIHDAILTLPDIMQRAEASLGGDGVLPILHGHFSAIDDGGPPLHCFRHLLSNCAIRPDGTLVGANGYTLNHFDLLSRELGIRPERKTNFMGNAITSSDYWVIRTIETIVENTRIESTPDGYQLHFPRIEPARYFLDPRDYKSFDTTIRSDVNPDGTRVVYLPDELMEDKTLRITDRLHTIKLDGITPSFTHSTQSPTNACWQQGINDRGEYVLRGNIDAMQSSLDETVRELFLRREMDQIAHYLPARSLFPVTVNGAPHIFDQDRGFLIDLPPDESTKSREPGNHHQIELTGPLAYHVASQMRFPGTESALAVDGASKSDAMLSHIPWRHEMMGGAYFIKASGLPGPHLAQATFALQDKGIQHFTSDDAIYLPPAASAQAVRQGIIPADPNLTLRPRTIDIKAPKKTLPAPAIYAPRGEQNDLPMAERINQAGKGRLR